MSNAILMSGGADDIDFMIPWTVLLSAVWTYCVDYNIPCMHSDRYACDPDLCSDCKP